MNSLDQFAVIHNKINFGVRCLRITFIAFLCFAFFWYEVDFKTGIIIFLILEFYIVMFDKYIELISFDGIQLTVKYTKWFREKTLNLSLTNATVKIEKVGGYRGGTSFLITINKDNKKVFEVDSNNGFDKFTFQEFAAKLINYTQGETAESSSIGA